MGIHYVYIAIGICTLILNAILIYFYIRTNKKQIPEKHGTESKKESNSLLIVDDSTLYEEDYTMSIDNSNDQ
ncbi:MAG TPA: hypothetical protein VIO64_06870 [Pseudobacteroides sp.]|uniref:hypothetical protein n=1 Tax=Pseudobacteroides sp. TaxID=1968840 RepID=UPI002F93D211